MTRWGPLGWIMAAAVACGDRAAAPRAGQGSGGLLRGGRGRQKAVKAGNEKRVGEFHACLGKSWGGGTARGRR